MAGFIQSGRFASAAWTPLSIAGCVGWFDASDAATITSSGGLVSQWDDKSGSSHHLVQADVNYKPVTGAHTINGLNVIQFDGATDQMRATAQWVSASTGNFSAFVVFKPASVSGVQMIMDFDNEGATRIAQAFRLNGTTTQAVRIAGGVFTESGSAVASGTAYIGTTVQGASSLEVWVNGSSGGATSMTGTNGKTTSPLGIAVHPSGYSGSNHYAGDIAAMILYDTELGTTDREAVESFLNAQWAVY